MAANDLVSLGEAEQFLESPSSDQALVQALITRASEIVRRYTRRRFITESYTDELDGGHVDLILRHRPIDTAVAVQVEDTSSGSPIVIDSSQYVIYPERGFLRRKNGRWAPGLRRWRITYDAGLFANTDEVAGDVKQATLDIVAALYGRSGTDPTLQSETIGDYSYRRREDLDALGVPDSAVAVLDLWREPSF